MAEGEEHSSEVVKEQSESVAAANLKTLGDGPAFYMNQQYAESVAQTQAMNQIRIAIVGKVAEALITTQPGEGGVDVAGMQALSKMVGNIPPVTP